MLSGRGLCDELITRPEESYRLWCIVVCDLETSRIGAPYIYDISNLRVKGDSGAAAVFMQIFILCGANISELEYTGVLLLLITLILSPASCIGLPFFLLDIN